MKKRLLGAMIGAVLALSSAWGSVPAQEPEQTWLYPHGALTHLERVGNDLYAFAGWTRGYGIMAFDVTDPMKPRLKSGIAMPGYVNAPIRRGDTMYIPSLFGLFVLDTANGKLALKRNLLLGFTASASPGQRVMIAGKQLLVTGKVSTRLFDISTPSAPLLETFNFALGVKNIFSDGERFLTYDGAVIFALSDQGELNEIAKLPAPVKAVMAVGEGDGRMLLVQDRANVLTLYAITATTLVEKSRLENVKSFRRTSGGLFVQVEDSLGLLADVTKGELKTVRDFPMLKDSSPNFEFDGKHFYVMEAGYNRSIKILDAGKPDLDVITTIPVCRSDGSLEITDKAVYLGSGNMLLAFDKKNPEMIRLADGRLDVSFETSPNPQQGGKQSFGAYNLLSPSGIQRFGHYLLFSGALIDISKPLQPTFVDIVTAPHLGVSADGDRAAFAQGDRITIADLSNLPTFKTLGTYTCQTNQGPILDVHLRGNRMYAIDTGHFYVFDVADSAQIKLLNTVEADRPCAIAATDEFIYIPSGNTGKSKIMLAYDVRNGAVTEIEGLIHDGVTALAVDGNRLFLADGISIVQYDLANPLQPVRVAEYTSNRTGETPDQRTGYTELQIEGDKLYARKYSRVDTWVIADKGEK